jgi:peptidyl-tRNA hydrolase, PTH1 family
MADKYLIVGLGNPGREYENTRHNIGFMAVDALITRHNLGTPRKDRKALIYEGTIAGQSVLVIKPQTYMNLSGESVRPLLDFYKIALSNLMVLHDDMDIPLGTLRIRQTGSAGGQNGVKSIIQHLGTQDFARMRIGIGRPPGKQIARDYVLNPFRGDDAILAHEVVDTSANAVETWLRDGISTTMNRFNGEATGKDAAPTPQEELALALRAVELAPKDPRPLEKLAKLYKKLQRLDDAVETHLKIAELLKAQGKTKGMLHEWENAASIRPDLTTLREDIARAYEEHNDTRSAVQAWLKLAEKHQTKGNVEGARQAIAEAVRLNPQHPKVVAMQEELEKQ